MIHAVMVAGKLCVPVEMVQHGVEGLMFLMTESSKHMVRNNIHVRNTPHTLDQ